MTRLEAVICISMVAAACGSGTHELPTSPTRNPVTPSVPLPTPTVTVVGVIVVGQLVTGALEVHDTANLFELTAPLSGTLVAQLSWPAAQGNLSLSLADVRASSVTPNPPLVARLPIVAGQKYQLRVADAAPWDYDVLHVTYLLTTAIQ